MRVFNKSESTGDYELPPAGTQAAVLTVFACLGRHQSTWQGQTRDRELAGLQYELAEPGADGRPLAVNEIVTLSTNDRATLFARILALCGGREPPPGYPLEKLLGRGVILNITHTTKPDGKVFANVAGATPLLRGMNPPTPSAPPAFFDVLTPDPAAYAALPARFRKLADLAMEGNPPAPPPAPWSPPPAGPAPRPATPPAAGPWGTTPPAAPAYHPPGPPPAADGADDFDIPF